MKHEVLAIRHVYFEDLGSLELVLGDRGQLVRYLDVGRGRIDAPNPLDPSLMVVLGGPIGAYEEASYPHLTPLLSMLEKRIAAGLPTIGICLGSQLIARALGARVYPAAQQELGWAPLDAHRCGPRVGACGISKPTANRCPSSIGTAIPSISPTAPRCWRRRLLARIRRSPGASTCSRCNAIRKCSPTASKAGSSRIRAISRKAARRVDAPARRYRAPRPGARTRRARDVRRMARPVRFQATLGFGFHADNSRCRARRPGRAARCARQAKRDSQDAGVASACAVGETGIEGDEQCERKHHGGPEKALHHYSFDHYATWREEWIVGASGLERFQTPGAFGENLSTRGIDENDVCVGDVFRIGTAIVQVSQARQPCWKLNLRFSRDDMSRRVQETRRTGWYYRVLEPGEIGAGDAVERLARPHPEWTVARLLRVLYVDRNDRASLEEMATLDTLTAVLAQHRREAPGERRG